jgi:nucleotide-binding universal stress UspA family protein
MKRWLVGVSAVIRQDVQRIDGRRVDALRPTASPADADSKLGISADDEHTVRRALALAARSGGELRLLHVVDFIDRQLVHEHLVDSVRAQLADAFALLSKEAAGLGVGLMSEVVEGQPWRRLLEHADSWGADVIAVSRRRRELPTLDRLRQGSTTDRLVRNAACPVWVVDGGASASPRKILALVDGTAASAGVIDAARRLAANTGADKAVLHCLSFPDDIALHQLPDAREALARYHHDEKARATRLVEDLVAEPGWTVLIDVDWVVRTVPKLVARDGYDLIVAAARSHPGLRGLLGTTAERILARNETSCWIVPCAAPDG